MLTVRNSSRNSWALLVLAAVLVVVVPWVKPRNCLKPVCSDPTLTNMSQQPLWIFALLRVCVHFYRYWSLSWSKQSFFFLPNVSLLLTANQKCCRNLPADVKASKLIILAADGSVQAKIILEYKSITISDKHNNICLYTIYLIFVSRTSLFPLFHKLLFFWFNSIVLLPVPFLLHVFFPS